MKSLFDSPTAQLDFPQPWPYWALVTNHVDPLKLGRVKVTVPGQIQESDWAIPVGQMFGGSRGKGGPKPPPKGARVLVMFVGGNPEAPIYWYGGWAKGDPPSGHEPTADGDKTVWRDERVEVVVDSRLATAEVTIRDKATGLAASLSLDFAANMAELQATTGVRLRSTGAVEIEGAAVTINDRPVLPGTKPI